MLRIFKVLAVTALLAFLFTWSLDRAALSLFRSSCRCEAASVSFSYFPPRVKARGIRVTFGDPETTEVRAEAEELEAPFSPVPLLHRKIRVGRARVKGLQVIVTEGDKKSPGGGRETPDLRIEGVKIEAGEFVYKRTYPHKTAELRVHDIRGTVGPFGSGDWASAPCSSQVQATLEKSGKVNLSVDAAYFSPTPDVKVVLKIEEQDLQDLNSYFFPSDGVNLSGRLHSALGVVSLKGKELQASVMARYSDFDVKLHANRERSGLEAFFGNLLSGLKIDEGDLDEERKQQQASVGLQRKSGESVVSALLRGLKEAVLKVAST